MEYPPTYWASATNFINSKVAGTQALGIWVVGVDWDNGSGGDMCHLTFPRPSGGSTTNIDYESTDLNASYLSAFDTAGQKVLLEIESGDADVPTLIDLVLNQYKSHPCVAGVSVDIEWIHPSAYSDGKAVTDAEASAWLTKIKSYNSSYMLNLVHWETGKMPPAFRDANLIIENDGLGYSGWSNMLSDSKSWGTYFSNANVGFMVGFDEDYSWISKVTDPAGTIMNGIFNGVSNCKVIYWASWTIPDIFAGSP
jgi:hypothetical protein